MITFHKIVLAIAGLLNNGISSPAPQGNPALRNRTTALASAFAERQEPTSAKTPPILHRIGKFWIPILLVIVTALMTSETKGADSTSTNQIQIPLITPGMRAAVQSMIRHAESGSDRMLNGHSVTGTSPTLLAQVRLTLPPTILQPAAVPLAPPASPVIKKAVLHVGTYLVCAVREWFIGKQLDSLTQAELDKADGQSATCGIEWVEMGRELYHANLGNQTLKPRPVMPGRHIHNICQTRQARHNGQRNVWIPPITRRRRNDGSGSLRSSASHQRNHCHRNYGINMASKLPLSNNASRSHC